MQEVGEVQKIDVQHLLPLLHVGLHLGQFEAIFGSYGLTVLVEVVMVDLLQELAIRKVNRALKRVVEVRTHHEWRYWLVLTIFDTILIHINKGVSRSLRPSDTSKSLFEDDLFTCLLNYDVGELPPHVLLSVKDVGVVVARHSRSFMD